MIVTSAGSVIAYLQNQWSLTSPGTASIKFSDDWYDAQYLTMPQIVIRESYSPKLEQFTTGGSMTMRAAPRLQVDVGCYVPPGSSGTQEKQWIDDMRHHVADIFRYGWGQSPKYGGSISPLRFLLPDDHGRVVSDEEAQPRWLRYVLTLSGTEDF